MEFDKNKILTSVTADQAKAGDMGWITDTLTGMRAMIERGDAPKELAKVLPDDYTHRFKVEANAHTLFYPAPYEFLQEQWVKENGLEIGDKVRATRAWEDGEGGFDYSTIIEAEEVVYKVVNIRKDYIVGTFQARLFYLPYFAIEKVKEPEYRRFANAEEFAPYRDEWFSWVGGDERDACRVTSYGDDGVVIAGEVIDYERFCGEWRFSSDTGEPAGVKL